jgi:hypothetical protein
MERAQSLIMFLSEIEDTRQARGKRHEQLALLVLMICTEAKRSWYHIFKKSG